MTVATPTPLSALSVAERSATPVTGARTLARGAFTAVVAIYAMLRMTDPTWWDLLDDVNLAVHEAGHVLFSPFGDIPGVLGGSLFQIIIPAIFAGYFLRSRQRFSAAMTLAWVAQSMVNVSVYIKDARAQDLPLLGGESSIHDWWYILINWDLLQFDLQIGGFVHLLAGMLFSLALGLGALITYRDAEIARSAPTTPPPRSHS
jgi:hypothetical protein